MLKRILCSLVALGMVTALLASCSGEGSSSSGEKSSSGEQQSSADDGNSAPVKLKAVINVGNPMTREPDTMASFQGVEKETNIDVEWQVERTGWDEKKTLLLASGDLPDMFFGNRTLTMSDVIANKSSLTDLTPFIENSTYVKQMFEEEPSMKALVQMEDGIYSMPAKMPLRPKTFTVMFINKTWLDKLGLPIPTTTEEYYDTLKSFKENDPNGNNLQDEIPLETGGTGNAMNALWCLFTPFGVADEEQQGSYVMVKDSNLHFSPTLDGYKDAVLYAKRLYSEGLIDNEIFTQDGSQFNAKLYSSDPQIVGSGAGWTIASSVSEANKNDYVVLPPLKGPDGTQMWRSQPMGLSMIPNSWELSKSCKDPEAAFRFIDAMYNPETSVQFYFGSYGETLEKKDDGTVVINDPEDPKVTYNDKIWEVGFGDMGPFYVNKAFEEKIVPNSWVTDRLDQEKAYLPYVPNDDQVYPPMLYSQEDSNEMSVLKTDILTIVNEKLATWVTGEADINAEWDSYKSSLDAVGLPRLMEIYQKYWEASRQ